MFGCIKGFEDLGTHSKTSNMAIHAPVFMLRGRRKNYKQAVARLIHRSNKGEMLVNFLMEVFDACQNAGLEIVATMYDVGANNVKALKLLDVTPSGFRIEKLQLCLILPISLNLPAAFPRNMM
jgi:hypothetical protein